MAGTLREHPRPGSNSDGAMVAAPLSHGSNPNSNAAGRRREDDENLVLAHALEASDGHHGYSSPRGDGADNLIAGPLGGGNDGIGRRSEDDPNLVASTGVRRLTPTECERLQAWPDGWTNPDGKAPDSRRYAACGDGVTATVSEWIGRRILSARSAAAPRGGGT